MDKVLALLNKLKALLPHREPVVYLFLVLVGYQVLVKGESVPQEWVQYVIEAVLAGGLRQIVSPVFKSKEISQ